MSHLSKIASWTAQIVASGIMLIILSQQLTASPEAIFVFTKIGLEPFGRISSALIELVAAVCLISGFYVWQGAMIGLIAMSTATIFHFTRLGINVMNDHGLLFCLALITLICCITIIFIRREQIILNV